MKYSCPSRAAVAGISVLLLSTLLSVAHAKIPQAEDPVTGIPRPDFGIPQVEETLAYDDGLVHTWWSSDRDSFGAAVRFTPSMYPCEILGALAVVHHDVGSNIHLRVYDDNGSGGLPGTVLYDQLRSDIPGGRDSSYKDYTLTDTITVESGDFYLCFFQKHVWDMIFASDAALDSASREWWYFPDLGWRTPFGMDAADHLIRARVRYATGITEELGFDEPGGFSAEPSPVQNGRVVLRYRLPASGPARILIYDAIGRPVRSVTVPVTGIRGSEPVDLKDLPPGLYFARIESRDFAATVKLTLLAR